jgi:alpha-galactosidase
MYVCNTNLSFGYYLTTFLTDDNCFSDAATGYPDVDYTPDVSPEQRYANMTEAILATGRPMVFQICDWGVDFPSAWAPALGNSWRIANDIIPAYQTIPRILNQAVPQTSLEVGNNVFTNAEEQTHFSLWAIVKSPLVIGAALKDAYTSISAASLAILKNTDVISYNQDSLGAAASFRRRWTDEGYEVWAGPLSGGRTVVAVINLNDVARSLTLDLPDVGLQTARIVRDVWNEFTTTSVVTSYTGTVQAHGTLLLELSDTTASGQYTIGDALVSG